MEIHICNDIVHRPLKAAILAAALNDHRILHTKGIIWSFEVEEWKEFLHIYWNACAECSRDKRGIDIEKPLHVGLIYKGKPFRTKVWYDRECKGLRYVCL